MIDVLVVGAGPTGMMLAIELLRRKISVRVIDASEKPFEGSRGKGVQPRSLEILDMIGIVDDLTAYATLYPFMKIHLGPLGFKARSLGTHHAPTEDRPHPNMLMSAQWQTEAVLRHHVEALGGKIEYGVGLESFVQNAANIAATLTSGEVVTSAYLVGCDGGRSPTRKVLGLSLVGETLDDKTMIVADLEITDLDRNFWHVWPLHRGGPRSLAPLPASNLFQLQTPEAIAAKGLEKGVLRTSGKKVERVVWQSRFKHQSRMVEKYRVGRVFLAGDAAHVHPPSGAQGLNTGLQDAWNLGWKLASAIRTGDATILDTYEAERLPIAAAMLNLTKTLHVKASTQRGELTNQLSVGYRDGPLARGKPAGGLFPGDRAPDERLADGRRLLELMRHGGATQIIRPKGDHVLVRPDGYVAEISRRPIDTYYGHEVVHVDGR